MYVNKTKQIEHFSADYQLKIRSTWRFAAHRYMSDKGLVAPRTNDTMDVV